MTKRRAFWSLAVLFLLCALALLIPSSPAFAPKLLARYANVHEGHGAGYWTDALHDPNPEVRRKAAFALGSLGSDAEEAVPSLAAMMESDEESQRAQASLALSKLGHSARGAVPSLARALEDESPRVRINAARTLVTLGPEARPATPALLKALRSRENEALVPPFFLSIQEVSAVALGRVTAGSDEAVPALIEALEGATTLRMREAVVRGLGDVGPCARAAEPQLRALLKDKEAVLRTAAAEALEKIGVAATPAG
jgi:HEAT repeat protein